MLLGTTAAVGLTMSIKEQGLNTITVLKTFKDKCLRTRRFFSQTWQATSTRVLNIANEALSQDTTITIVSATSSTKEAAIIRISFWLMKANSSLLIILKMQPLCSLFRRLELH